MADPANPRPPSPESGTPNEPTRTRGRRTRARVGGAASATGIIAAALVVVLAQPGLAEGKGTFLTAWSATYTASLSDNNASCTLCHGADSDTSVLNAYGRSLMGKANATGFASVEALDADGDGTTNIAEINAGTQPGWRVGANNTLYDPGDGSVLLTGQLPPGNVGLLDPAAPPPTDTSAPTTTVPTVVERSGVALVGTAIPVTVKWTGADTGGSGIARYELSKTVDGGLTWTPVSASLASPTINVNLATAGTIRFRVRAVDVATNVGQWVSSRVITPRLVQNTGAITYAKTWTKQSSSAFSGGSVKYAKAKGATATIKTTGSSFAFVTTKARDRGYAWVYVNGVLKAKVNLYSATTKARQVAWQTSWAGAAPTIKIYVAGTSGRPRVDVDAFAILK